MAFHKYKLHKTHIFVYESMQLQNCASVAIVAKKDTKSIYDKESHQRNDTDGTKHHQNSAIH